ncbi:hypothetical protein M3484_18810 [Pseudomonas sp. GX19020]|uniref:hypothetical protein n=1 Tax=Pseudomonas sp. GX19020 TaxID=2942277 RepID=UPI00201911E7|nr:hypothetical protein [Pseudomonas sp. GX19020]MCL4068620.1 hypothetical protein [Pseudomonas sp. GX19020]
MAKHRDPLTKDLFEWDPPKVSVGYFTEVTGRGPLDNRIARIIGQALRDARDDGLNRAEVARQMTLYLRRTISEAMLNKWSSEGSEDHRIPLDAFIALVHATDARELLCFVPGEFGMTVIESEYAVMIKLHLIREKKQQLEAQEQALERELMSKGRSRR